MKKIVSLALALCLLLSVFSFANAESDKVTVRLWRPTFNLNQVDEEQLQKVENAINEYIADKINVQIKLTDIPSGEFADNANMAVNNREIDLLWTASWQSVVGTKDLLANGAALDITDLLPGTKVYESMAESAWEATADGGRNYFIPVYKDNVEGYDFLFRKEMVDKYGWDVTTVKTLADLEPMLADAKAEGLKYPYLSQKTAMFYRWYLDSFDFVTHDSTFPMIVVSNETKELVNAIQTPEYAEFAKLMGEWAEKGYLSEDDLTKTTTDTTTQTQDWAVTWWTDLPVNAEAESRYNQEVVLQPATNRYAHSESAKGSCYAITTTDETVAKAAIEFMGLLYTDSTLADIYTFGIEGEDFEYTQTEEQTIKHVTQHSDKYNHSMWESASATIVTPMYNEPDNKAELYGEFNGGALTAAAATFSIDWTGLEAEKSACQNLFDQYGFVLENGGVAPDAVDAYIAQYQEALDDAGFQKILEAVTEQYNAWKAE